MILPTFAGLAERSSTERKGWFCTPLPYHPHLRKYFWRVFHQGSPCEGTEFLRSPTLNSFEAQQLIDSLRAEGADYMIYCFWEPRRNKLFDPDSPLWKNAKWAPVFEDDPDPECNGFK